MKCVAIETKKEPSSSRSGLSRRGFLRKAGALVAGTAVLFTPQSSSAIRCGLFSWTPRIDNFFWRRIQGKFLVDPEVTYMNVGTTGSMPMSVLESYEYYNRLAAYHPRTYEKELNATEGLPAQREKLAAQFGCSPDEICLTRNTTDGLDAVVFGLKLNPGDEILITPHEHEASLSPLNVRQDRDGIILTTVDIPVLNIESNSPDIFLSAFEAKLSPSTKAILFSHICYTTGTRLPARELCNWAKDKGLISIVDGAHAPGMIQLDFHDIGCDFYAGSGHKWQCGPGGTGILYLRNHGKNLPEFWTQNSSMYIFAVQPIGNIRGTYDIAYSLQYHGQLNIPAHLAFVDACDLWEKIGRNRIEHHVLELSSYLKRKLERRFGSQGTLFSPDIHEFSSGLTSFNPFDDITDGAKIIEFVDRLESEAAYQIRYTDFKLASGDPRSTYACRISTHIFHDFRQIDGLVDAMYDICRTMI